MEKQQQITSLQTKYETEKQEKKIKIKNYEIRKNEDKIEKKKFLLAIYGLISIIVIIVLTFTFFYIKNRNTKKRKALKQEAIMMEQRLLRSQMNPQFIFNSLMAIQSFIHNNESETAIGYLTDFSSLLRLVLQNSREEYITLNKEVETLKYYLQLQELRFKDNLNYDIYIDPNINTGIISIPPMLAQPFIENTIEYGILHSTTRGRIDVRFILKENSFLFEVEENDIKLEEATKMQKEKHWSLAMEITKERLTNINQNKKQKTTLEIIDIKTEGEKKQGNKISFLIPFKKLKKVS